MDKLKECPFCGGEAKGWCEDWGKGLFGAEIKVFMVQCQADKCYAMQHGSTEEKVVKRWNRRDE